MSTDLARFIHDHGVRVRHVAAVLLGEDGWQRAHNDARILNQTSNDVSAKTFGDSEMNFSYIYLQDCLRLHRFLVLRRFFTMVAPHVLDNVLFDLGLEQIPADIGRD